MLRFRILQTSDLFERTDLQGAISYASELVKNGWAVQVVREHAESGKLLGVVYTEQPRLVWWADPTLSPTQIVMRLQEAGGHTWYDERKRFCLRVPQGFTSIPIRNTNKVEDPVAFAMRVLDLAFSTIETHHCFSRREIGL